ncbi:MAG: hypothetical protein R2766_12990 [Saprospiraceae bacterium]
MKQLIIAIACVALITSCGTNKKVNQTLNNKKMTAVYEIAINQAKNGNVQNFLDTRAEFVEVLGKEDNTLNEGKWKPFFTVDQSMKLDEILIGMTHWNSMQGFGETAMKLMPQEVTKNYFASFNPLAYGLLETVDGKPFDMETIKKEGNVIEFAIRKGKTDDAFGAKREAFFKSLENYDGYKFAREFKFYELDEQGMPKLAENTQAVIIVWENSEKFQAAATPIFGTKEYQEFAADLDVKSYFATFATK